MLDQGDLKWIAHYIERVQHHPTKIARYADLARWYEQIAASSAHALFERVTSKFRRKGNPHQRCVCSDLTHRDAQRLIPASGRWGPG